MKINIQNISFTTIAIILMDENEGNLFKYFIVKLEKNLIIRNISFQFQGSVEQIIALAKMALQIIHFGVRQVQNLLVQINKLKCVKFIR